MLLFGLAGRGGDGRGRLLPLQAGPEQIVKLTAGIDPNPVFTSYLGILLAGAMFLSLGLLVSSWVRVNSSRGCCRSCWGCAFVLPAVLRWWFDPGTVGDSVAYYLGVPEHFRRGFPRGVIDTRPLVLYASVTLCCLFLTVRSLQARRL